MSLLRIKSKMQYLGSETSKIWILYNLLKIFGKPDCRIKGWGKNVLGYGLQQKDFDNNETIEKVSSRQFKSYKDDLIKRKLIMRLDTKKDAYYTITPLGIIYLMKTQKLTSLSEVKQVLLILNHFNQTWHKKNRKDVYDETFSEKFFNKLQKHWKKQKGLPLDLLIEFMNESLNHIEIIKEENKTIIQHLQNLRHGVEIIFSKYSIEKSGIKQHYVSGRDYKQKYVDDLFYFHVLAGHVFGTYFYHLFKNVRSLAYPKEYKEYIVSSGLNRAQASVHIIQEELKQYISNINRTLDEHKNQKYV